jgi:hypothetical protein
MGTHNGEGLHARMGGESGCSAPFSSTLGVLLRVAPNAVVVQPVYSPLVTPSLRSVGLGLRLVFASVM